MRHDVISTEHKSRQPTQVQRDGNKTLLLGEVTKPHCKATYTGRSREMGAFLETKNPSEVLRPGKLRRAEGILTLRVAL
jgi:hypothetical protein